MVQKVLSNSLYSTCKCDSTEVYQTKLPHFKLQETVTVIVSCLQYIYPICEVYVLTSKLHTALNKVLVRRGWTSLGRRFSALPCVGFDITISCAIAASRDWELGIKHRRDGFVFVSVSFFKRYLDLKIDWMRRPTDGWRPSVRRLCWRAVLWCLETSDKYKSEPKRLRVPPPFFTFYTFENLVAWVQAKSHAE